MMKVAMMFWCSFALFTAAAAAKDLALVDSRQPSNSMTTCAYAWSAGSDLCWYGPSLVQISTVDHPTVDPGEGRDAYCQDYCDRDTSCMGFVAGAGESGDDSDDWIRCYISTDTPTGVFLEEREPNGKCWRKIPESCHSSTSRRLSEAPAPFIAPSFAPSPQPTLSLDESCERCTDAGCTWCQASEIFDDYPSVCVCDGLEEGYFGGCSDFSFGSDPKTRCRVAHRIRNVPVFVWPVLVIVALFMFCGICICLFTCKNGQASKGSANTGANNDEHGQYPTTSGTNAGTNIDEQESKPNVVLQSDDTASAAIMEPALPQSVSDQDFCGGSGFIDNEGRLHFSSNNYTMSGGAQSCSASNFGTSSYGHGGGTFGGTSGTANFETSSFGGDIFRSGDRVGDTSSSYDDFAVGVAGGASSSSYDSFESSGTSSYDYF